MTILNNKRGQVGQLGFSLLVAGMLFMIGMVTVNMLMPAIDQTRIDLNCTSASTIEDGVKLTCLFTDGLVPYFFVLVISMAGGYATKNLLT